MPILKYKLNGEWVTLSGGAGAGSDIKIDSSLSIEGAAADAKATGDVVGALSESIGEVEAEVGKKQNKIIFNATQPADWVDGDIWLKPAE